MTHNFCLPTSLRWAKWKKDGQPISTIFDCLRKKTKCEKNVMNRASSDSFRQLTASPTKVIHV